MSQSAKDTKPNKKQEDPAAKPDPETLHTTDPQEHMKGPVSSVVQKVKEGAEENDAKDKKEEQTGKKN